MMNHWSTFGGGAPRRFGAYGEERECEVWESRDEAVVRRDGDGSAGTHLEVDVTQGHGT